MLGGEGVDKGAYAGVVRRRGCRHHTDGEGRKLGGRRAVDDCTGQARSRPV